MGNKRLAQIAPSAQQNLTHYFGMCGVWAVSPYQACDLRCSYCVTYAQGTSTPKWDAAAAVQRLDAELAEIPDDASFCVGGLIDAYPHAEEDACITRGLVRRLIDHDRRFVIVTKGTTVLRDRDILAEHPKASVSVSVWSDDDAAVARYEPHVAPASERIEAIGELAASGVNVTMQVQPWVPGVSNVERLAELVPPSVKLSVGALNVQSPMAASSRLGREFTQSEINRAFLEARELSAGRPNIDWNMAPWIREPSADDPRGHAADIQRLVTAINNDDEALVVLEILSPWVQAHDPEVAGRGVVEDALMVAKRSLRDFRVEIESVEVDGLVIDTVYKVTGSPRAEYRRLTEADGPVTVMLEYRYRMDDQGLIVEFWQRVR